MAGNSLQRYLLIRSAIWAAVALSALGVVLTWTLWVNVEQAVQQRLRVSFHQLSSIIETNGGLSGQPDALLADPGFIIPASGKYWQVQDLSTGRIERSRSLWNFNISVPESSDGLVVADGPGGQELFLVSQTLRLQGDDVEKQYRITVAERRQSLLEILLRYGGYVAAALFALFLIIVVVAWIQVRMGLAPIIRLRESVEQIRHSNGTALNGTFPDELRPLVSELNELLVLRENSLQFARARAADLAHGIKTPLSVFLAIADRLEAQGEIETATAIRELTDEISDRINYQLQLARLRVRSESQVMSSSLGGALNNTLSVLKKTHKGERIVWTVNLGRDTMVDIDTHDLVELLGSLLENACKWASSRVVIDGRCEKTKAILTIADDGPGVSDEQLTTLGSRGRRFDETRPGSGMGLAIAKEIASLNRGSLAWGRSAAGGLLVILTLPVSQARRRQVEAAE